MGLVKLEVDRIQYSETQTGAYILFLKEPISHKKIPIVIGGMEAHSIAIALEDGIKPQRPLTHDLMKSVMDTYHIHLNKVIIDKFEEGIFYAKLITEQKEIVQYIDSRTSDAIALAVRFKAPIYCEQNILDETGILITEINPAKAKDIAEDEELMEVIQQAIDNASEKEDIKELTEIQKLNKELFGKINVIFTKKEIEELLDQAIEEEQYEKAAKLKRYLELI
jgi:bifunctional DNase/RNase